MNKRYQVFISSTFKDLQEERREVAQVLLELDCIPSGMELFPAANETQWEIIKKVIDDCDYYILILAGKYGSIAEDGLSYTEKEYDYATKIGKPILSFTHKDIGKIIAEKTENTDSGKEKLKKFKGKVREKLCGQWENATELGAIVVRSMNIAIKNTPAVGWVRGDSIAENTNLKTSKQVEMLSKRITDISEKINNITNIGRQTYSQTEMLSNQFTDKFEGLKKQINSVIRGAGTFLYINGENEAFAALTAALSRAKSTIRTTRYSPPDVGVRQKEFAKMIQNRVLGENDHAPINHFYRIVAANDMSKRESIKKYIDNFFAEDRFTLYLTPHVNNFELVIIDEAEVFIHFHGNNQIIDSTLHIVMEDVVRKFIDIYSSLHDPKLYPNVRKYDYGYVSGKNVQEIHAEIDDYFEQHCGNKSLVK